MKIFVGNFAPEINEDDLRSLFSMFGEVDSVSIIYDKYTHESRCFGYVVMPNPKIARIAIYRLNGKEIKGRKIHVNQARTQSKGYPGDERRKKISGSSSSQSGKKK
jgi:RNA recognition motif-containing protein